MTISFSLPRELESRLKALADKAEQSSDDQLKQIVEQGIEDLEDYYAGQEVKERIARGEEKVLSSEDFWCGVDH